MHFDAGFFIFIKTLWITWKVYTLSSAELIEHINYDSVMFHLKIDIFEFFIFVFILPVFYLNLWRSQAQHYLPYGCMVLLISMLVFDWYSSGLLAAGIINVMSFIYLMIVLFERKMIFFSLVYLLLTFSAIHMSGIVTGEYQYAPMFNFSAIGYPNFKNLFWLASTLYFSVPPFLIGIFILSTILNQWRKREIFITELSQKDDLTGIYNRRVLTQHLLKLDQDPQTVSSYAILLLDLDHFKRVNDTYGHIVGDQVLIQLAQILKQNLRTDDLLGRYGGEEFLIIIHNFTKCIESQNVADRHSRILDI